MKATTIIERRKALWYESLDINQDNDYREATAAYMLSNKGGMLRQEVQMHPEYLIEMFYVIVDKDQVTVPFFLNEVQMEFMEILNKDKKDYEAGNRLHLKYLILKGRQQG